MTTPPYQTTDLRPGRAIADLIGTIDRDLAPPAADDFNASPLTVRLDRIRVGHDELWEAITALTEALRPVLGSDPYDPADAQPEWPADGNSPLASSLALHGANAAHLAARVRAITAAVDL